MFKPENYDSTNAIDSSRPKPPEGDYICTIVAAQDLMSKSGKNMIELSLDIATGNFAGCFEDKPRKYYQLYGEEKQTAYFKGMITALERSNPGFKFAFDANNYFDVNKFVGLKVGAAMVKEPYEFTDRETGMPKKVDVLKITMLRSVQSVKEPINCKEMAAQTSETSQPEADEDIPF